MSNTFHAYANVSIVPSFKEHDVGSDLEQLKVYDHADDAMITELRSRIKAAQEKRDANIESATEDDYPELEVLIDNGPDDQDLTPNDTILSLLGATPMQKLAVLNNVFVSSKWSFVDLAKYVRDDNAELSKLTHIYPEGVVLRNNVFKLQFAIETKPDAEITEITISNVHDYLAGQISDGYGENGIGESNVAIRELPSSYQLRVDSDTVDDKTARLANMIHEVGIDSSDYGNRTTDILENVVMDIARLNDTDSEMYEIEQRIIEHALSRYLNIKEPVLNCTLWADYIGGIEFTEE